ncbi:MAG: N-acetylmuramoyl-L-alanine amidase [Acidiferrobacter sp.]
MKQRFLTMVVAGLFFWAALAQAATRIGRPLVRVGPHALIVRLLNSRHVVWRSFSLIHPARVVVDLHGVALPRPSAMWPEHTGPLKDIRAFRHRNGMVRIVFDLARKVPYEVSALPGGLTVSLGGSGVLSLPKTKGRPQAVALPVAGEPRIAPPTAPPDIVIAVDPGHGGIDRGACGIDGICEKNVVLHIARDLGSLIDATPGFHAFLTRRGNYYVPLRERVALAQAHHAAAFISIHANALPEPEGMNVRGAEVFILSQHGVSREARWLAHSENAADQMGALHFGAGGGFLHNILLNMTQNGTRRASYDLARDVLQALGAVGPLHVDHVEKANFMVLLSPTIPSILIETAFISNPREALDLDSPVYDERLAHAVWEGIMRDAPRLRARLGMSPGPRLYVVRAGETLSGIAQRFHVSIAALRAANGLRGELQAGTSLRIPSG